jgi:flagellar biosynthesis protein FlhF
MQLKTFRASNMAECLSQVKAELGTEAVILHTRAFSRRAWMGLRQVEVVEITAGRGMHVRPRPTAVAGAVPATRAPATRAPAGTLPTPPAPPGRELLGSSTVANIAALALKNELETVKTLIKDLAHQVRQGSSPDVPEELFDQYRLLIENQVAEELARDVVRRLRDTVRPEHLVQCDFVREKLADQLERLIPTSGPIVRTKAVGPHVVALIGPTGVGKTTTIAKLAAALKLRERRRVGLITIDTYRIAAVDQLRKYAEILGSPLKVVNTPDDIREAVTAMSDHDFVLIDTAGRSPNDALKLNELKQFLSAAGVDETHLVLSSTASERCVELAMEKFGDVSYDKLIFTKLDEAASVGVLLNVIRKVNKSLSYVTTGQDVPDDIEIGRARRLAQLILGVGL